MSQRAPRMAENKNKKKEPWSTSGNSRPLLLAVSTASGGRNERMSIPMPIAKPTFRQIFAPRLTAKVCVRGSAVIMGCIASAAFAFSAATVSAGGSNAPSTNRDKNQWTTAVVVPKPAMKCEPALKVVGIATGSGPHSELQARYNAIETWRAQVADRHGYDYAQWWRARDKDVSCRAAGGGHACEALAAPCMAEGGASNGMGTRSGLGMVGSGR